MPNHNTPRARRRLGSAVIALLVAAGLAAGSAQAQPFHAGVARITVPADPAFDALVWYPSDAEEVPWQSGAFPMPATRDAAMAGGQFPVVLLSHGGGETGGSPLILRGLSAALARQGMIVLAPFHGKLNRPAVTRPRQIGQALLAMAGNVRLGPHADLTRVGMVGFSLGGGIALLTAGGRVDMAHWAAWCDGHSFDYRACSGAPTPAEAANAAALPPAPTLPLKALVLLDPFGAAFTRDSLATVTMPVLIVRPAQSDLSEAGNAQAVAEALPNPPRYETVPGGHFIFTDTCIGLLGPPQDWCQDPPGVDRAAVHAQVEAVILAFLHDAL